MSVKKQKAHWLCYFSYIINLYAQAFIIGVNAKNIYKELAAAYYNQDFKKIELLQKKHKVVRLLYNLIQYIRITPQCRTAFKKIKISSALAKFNGLEVCDKILYRALVLRFRQDFSNNVKRQGFNSCGFRLLIRQQKIKIILLLFKLIKLKLIPTSLFITIKHAKTPYSQQFFASLTIKIVLRSSARTIH